MLRLRLLLITVLSLSLIGAATLYISYKKQLFGELLRRVETTRKVVALTFDDGPNPPYTNQLLDTLAEAGVQATFFMLGKNIELHPETARAIVQQGHEAGNHSYSHSWMVLRSPAFVREEIRRTEDLLRSIGVHGTVHFRSPFGAQFFSVPYVMAGLGRHNILFDVVPRDWETQNAALIAQRVVAESRPGSIILLHDGGGRQDGTVKATREIIERLKDQGYEFVTVTDLLKEQ